MKHNKFLDIEPKYSNYNNSKFVVLPIPFEETTSYVKGTRYAPQAILEASYQVETFDEELVCEPYESAGIYTEKALKIKPTQLSKITKTIKNVIKDHKIPVVLGGEHSITPWIIKAFIEKYKDLSVLQIDAHADLRDRFHGRKDSHACAMRRLLEFSPNLIQVGIRNISKEGYSFARKSGQINKIHFMKDIVKMNWQKEIKNIIKQLNKKVYISLDVDGLDTSVVPATGTFEPGGLGWYQVLDLFKEMAKQKEIVGFDVVELCPEKEMPTADFAVAKLIYKIISYIQAFKK